MNLSIRLVLIIWPVATWQFKPLWIVQNRMILLKMIKISVWLFYTIMKRSGALARESYFCRVLCFGSFLSSLLQIDSISNRMVSARFILLHCIWLRMLYLWIIKVLEPQVLSWERLWREFRQCWIQKNKMLLFMTYTKPLYANHLLWVLIRLMPCILITLQRYVFWTSSSSKFIWPGAWEFANCLHCHISSSFFFRTDLNLSTRKITNLRWMPGWWLNEMQTKNMRRQDRPES